METARSGPEPGAKPAARARTGPRLGVLGGTFDPVHNGHLLVAGRVREAFGLSSVVLIPSAQPPHKPGSHVSPFADRLAMLNLAAGEASGLVVSPMELGRPGPSYSIDTLRQLRRDLPAAAELFFLIGADAFAEISSWKNHAELLGLAHFIVMARPPFNQAGIAQLILTTFPGHVQDPAAGCWLNPASAGRIHILDLEPVPISSTAIRGRVRQSLGIAGLVPPAVAAYIEIHGLYRE